MGSKIFLDANVLLDFTLKRESYSLSKQLITLVVSGKAQAYITPSIVHIVGYWLTKAYGNAKAKELLLSLLADINVIDIPHEVCLNALHSRISDIEDALQYYTAIHHKLDYFVTRDKKLVKEAMPVLPIYTTEEILEGIL